MRFEPDLTTVGADAVALCIFIRSAVTAPFIEAHPALRFITTRSRTYEHIDMGACARRGIVVSRVPSYASATVVEHTFALILALSRRLREAMTPRAGRFSYETTRAFDLSGKTLGVLGLGAVGWRVAVLAQAFNMRVLAWDPRELSVGTNVECAPLETVLEQAHVLTLHLRIGPETHHIMNAATFALCRPGVVLINTARGALVDTHALREALESGQVGGAGLDVMEEERVMSQTAASIIGSEIIQHLQADKTPAAVQTQGRLQQLQDLMLSSELLRRPNVVFTPHAAFNSVEAVAKVNDTTLENIQAFLAGKPINLVTG